QTTTLARPRAKVGRQRIRLGERRSNQSNRYISSRSRQIELNERGRTHAVVTSYGAADSTRIPGERTRSTGAPGRSASAAKRVRPIFSAGFFRRIRSAQSAPRRL